MLHVASPFSVPKPSLITVTRTPQMIYAGSNFTLHCNIQLDASTDDMELSEPLEVFVNWTGPEIGMMAPEVKLLVNNSSMYRTSISISSADDSHGGNYTCAAQVRAVNSPYLITSSESESVEITISMFTLLSLIDTHKVILYYFLSSSPLCSNHRHTIIKLNVGEYNLDDRKRYGCSRLRSHSVHVCRTMSLHRSREHYVVSMESVE